MKLFFCLQQFEISWWREKKRWATILSIPFKICAVAVCCLRLCRRAHSQCKSDLMNGEHIFMTSSYIQQCSNKSQWLCSVWLWSMKFVARFAKLIPLHLIFLFVWKCCAIFPQFVHFFARILLFYFLFFFFGILIGIIGARTIVRALMLSHCTLLCAHTHTNSHKFAVNFYHFIIGI